MRVSSGRSTSLPTPTQNTRAFAGRAAISYINCCRTAY
jgi:hypothetical protein